MAKKANKTTLYLAIACGVLALILIVVVVIVATSGGDPTIPVSAAVAATAAAAEATRRRIVSRNKVDEAKEEVETIGTEIQADHDSNVIRMEDIREKVENMPDKDLANEADNLFGGGENT